MTIWNQPRQIISPITISSKHHHVEHRHDDGHLTHRKKWITTSRSNDVKSQNFFPPFPNSWVCNFHTYSNCIILVLPVDLLKKSGDELLLIQCILVFFLSEEGMQDMITLCTAVVKTEESMQRLSLCCFAPNQRITKGQSCTAIHTRTYRQRACKAFL